MKRLSFVFVLIFGSLVWKTKAQNDLRDIQQRNPRVYQNFEILDSQGNYVLEWVVDWQENKIHFDVTVKTTGFVAFGLSARGEVDGADIVIGGVNNDGISYFSDRHGVQFGEPQVDQSQDWQLELAVENGTHTYLSFSRALDTCDNDDYLITEDTITLLWAYGLTDDPTREWNSNRNRGEYPVHLLFPNVVPRAIKEHSFRPGTPPRSVLQKENLNIWTISTRRRLPPQETDYHCTIHKTPRLGRKHHIVGFNIRLETEEAARHTHHLLLYRCNTPPGTDRRIFERFVGGPGQTCYALPISTGPIPTQYCTELVNGYGIGGRIVFFPDHTGQAFAESDDEYYALQVHYNNPERLTNLEYTVNLDMYYTSNLRPNELGFLAVGHMTPGSPSILIPPQSPNHLQIGHCSGTCTQSILPPEGINVFMTHLHTHYAGRKARMRIFRGGEELPWIRNDDNYDPFFQHFEMINGERKILPGDQITMRCEYDNTDANGTVVGGFATTQEMCVGFLYHYKKVEKVFLCGSEIEEPSYWRRYLGVNNITWDESQLDNVATSPRRVAGMTMKRISDTQVRWTRQLRNELQRNQLTIPQMTTCAKFTPVSVNGEINVDDVRRPVTLPRGVREYTPPPRNCVARQIAGQWPGRLSDTNSNVVPLLPQLNPNSQIPEKPAINKLGAGPQNTDYLWGLQGKSGWTGY